MATLLSPLLQESLARNKESSEEWKDTNGVLGRPECRISTARVSLSESGSATFGVRLTAQPPATTTVNVSSGDPSAATAGPATLTFTTANWNTLQTVTVAGVADADLNSESVTLTLASSGLSTRTVTATVTDDDVQSILASPNPLDMIEGDIDYLGVRLAFQPAANVTVTVTCSNTTVATVSPASVTFTPANWSAIQEITVTSNYESAIRNRSATLTLSASGHTNSTVPVFVTDVAL